MLNYYHVLCISPTASRSDIEAALAKQRALGKLPAATLRLAADTLLSPASRQVYDDQLARLPELNQAYALSADDLSMSQHEFKPASSDRGASNAPPHQAASDASNEADNSITLYNDIRLPETPSKAFSMAKVKHAIMTSPVIWLLFGILVLKLIAMATQESEYDKAKALCIETIQAQLAYPDSMSIKPHEPEYPWKHRQIEFPVAVYYIAQPVPNTTQSYRADCVYNAKQKKLINADIFKLEQ